MRSHPQSMYFRWSAACRLAVCLLSVANTVAQANPDIQPTPPPLSVVGVVARTHAVRHPAAGGFGNTLEFQFIRFLEHEKGDRELAIQYAFEWITAMPQDFGRGRELLQRQSHTFAAPTAVDRRRGYQTSSVTLTVSPRDNRQPNQPELFGQQLRIKVLPSQAGTYLIVGEEGKLLREINRRWVEQTALCRIYEGCVIACFPRDLANSTDRHPLDISDLDQYVPDCYLIAALVAAVRRDPDQLRSLISQTPEGYTVTFPGQAPILVPPDLDRGPDMIESRALDVDTHGHVEIWPVLLERAFAVLNSRSKPNSSGPGQEFQDVSDGDSQQAYHILTGRPVTECTRWQFPNRAAQLQAIHQHLQSAKPVMMATGKWTDSGDRPHWWLEDHVYVITAIGASGKTLTLIDPSCGQSVERIKIGDWLDSSEVKRFLFCE